MRGQFRGINMYLEGTNALKAVPDVLMGADPKDYILDRWLPLSDGDKVATNYLPEKDAEWLTAIEDKVYYGMERWGEMIPDNYTEYFAVIVIRVWQYAPRHALKVCSDRNFSGPKTIILP